MKKLSKILVISLCIMMMTTLLSGCSKKQQEQINFFNYGENIDDETIKELQIDKPEDVLVLSIITLGKTLETSTMNLQAPLVINIKSNLGKQYIMQNSKYETKHPLIRRD